MEATLEFQAVSVDTPTEASSAESPTNESVCEIKFGDPDHLSLLKLLKIPFDFELKGISVEIPLFASKEEVNNFCISAILLVEKYENLRYISICTNNSETLEDDLVENYRNDTFTLLSQCIFKLNPGLLFTDCLNCSNDIQTRRVRLLNANNTKILQSDVNFSEVKYKRRITDAFPRTILFRYWI